MLRVSLVEEAGNAEEMFVLETNIDDSSPEYLGEAFQSELLATGAADFSISPVTMKKGRSGILLSVLVDRAHLEAVSDFILENTTTIGVRSHPVSRRILERRPVTIDTDHGPIDAKEVTTPSGRTRLKVEHDALWAFSRKAGLSAAEASDTLRDFLKKEG